MNFSKRMLDIFLCIVAGLLLMGPVFIVASVVLVTSKGPVIFWSDRVGRNNKIFSMAKFRTMRFGAPTVATNDLQNPKSHLTSVGAFLRKTSLDELPQLWHIIRGEMSFVGPRPALFNQKELIELRSAKGVQILTPGLTGWAQVNGRDQLSIAEKVAFDSAYLESKSILFDIKILWLTLLRVVGSSGISH
ncbi:sugar transferase [Candidatus Njordibacter sp. Uisw_039]|uniref:sugar transferase n=1 Tax=Candidatus Njordibacter sp. Uisw_039 TaxID=3230972 RepID=UPI003D4A1050